MDLQHDNSHRTWFYIGTHHEKLVPGFVLDAPLLTKEASEDLPNSLFADEVRRLFPIDSPANCWLSAAYFAKNAFDGAYRTPYCDAVEQRLLKAASTYGIEEQVRTIMDAVSTPVEEKQAANQDNWGWISGSDKHFPMFDREGTVKAAAYFEDNRFLYPLEMRRSVARAIVKKASQYGVDVPDTIRREAGYGLPRRDTMCAEILDRAYRCKDAAVAEMLANIVENLAGAPMDEIQCGLDKLAELVDTVDQLEGLDNQYNKKVMAPADFLYSMDTKVAEALADDAVELDRHTFSISKLAELPCSVYADALGDEFADRVKTAEGKVCRNKLADELFSLPRPDRVALEDHLETL